MKKLLALGLLVISSSVLAGYKIGARDPGAELVIDAQSDSTKTTLTGIYAHANGDEKCAANKHGSRLGQDSTTGHAPSMKPVRIAANELFAFTATYSEARGGQNRMCSLSAAFAPLADRRYLARIVTTDQVGRCDLGIFDVTDGTARPIGFFMPEFVCAKKAPSKQPNGKPAIINGVILVPTFS